MAVDGNHEPGKEDGVPNNSAGERKATVVMEAVCTPWPRNAVVKGGFVMERLRQGVPAGPR